VVLTVSGLAKVAILRTNFHTKHQHSNLAKTVIRSTAPPLLPNPCYQHTLSISVVTVSAKLRSLARGLGRCVGSLFFLKGRRKILKFILSRKVEALLQALLCVSACVACKCAYTCVLAVNCLCQVSNTFLSVNKVAIAQYYSGQWFLVVRN
jgi:hypothetical protein